MLATIRHGPEAYTPWEPHRDPAPHTPETDPHFAVPAE